VCVPEVGLLPDHEPVAVYDVALVLDQLGTEEPPDATLPGAALNVTVGAGVVTTLTWTLRVIELPYPQHRSVKELVALSAPRFAEPTVGRQPDHALEA
jgi:hypothetical protein